ncbi:NAD(P)/FAD-dependent oxidoreductase [Roseateles saccharophilus]|uniref:Glycine/D-amino acid oxidase-like deaminating enzyme n=1 Tax=Roseateles saccharophilus TaxID=304 RepID=A0A4R3VL67_ROSSA|nr:FAD-dependent oxidoreductase [Roseateles saccharophilus]MDG0832917.1 FAD-dependent oxidoreductase [Roseateles saccharophilus]TCV04589.1 glycine/D-amino acid oxidase-like deaminating enzyme [Roseateles saccharophilus]
MPETLAPPPAGQISLDEAFAPTKLMPYWLDNPAAPSPAAELLQATQADLLIVGGGFTGLWAAIQAKEQSPELDVVLIEAGRVAFGASGRAGGIISTSVMHGLPNAVRVFPNDIEQLEGFGQVNLDGFEETLRRYGIDADIEWNGEMTVAVDEAHVDHLSADYALHRRYGHDVVLLDRAQTAAQIKSPLFAGALWSRHRSGIVHPAKLAWGLRRAAISLGVRLFENTPLLRLHDAGSHVEVQTPKGSVKAPRVLFGTGTAKVGVPDINRRVVQVRDHVLATEPLTDEQLARIGWAKRQGVYDTRTQLNYFRLTQGNNIIFGGLVSYHFDGNPDPAEDGRKETYHRLAAAFYRTFPQLGDVRFSHAWGGPIDYCSRGSVFAKPYLGGKAVFVAGYTGFGVAASRFGAFMGLNILFDRDSPERGLDIATQSPTYIPPEPFRWLGAKLTFHAFDGADAEGGWKRAWIKGIKALGFPM